MSSLGHKQTFERAPAMSALPSKADVLRGRPMSAKCRKRPSILAHTVLRERPLTAQAAARLMWQPPLDKRPGEGQSLFELYISRSFADMNAVGE